MLPTSRGMVQPFKDLTWMVDRILFEFRFAFKKSHLYDIIFYPFYFFEKNY